MITLPIGYKYSYTADRIGYMNTSGLIDLTDKRNIEQMQYSMPLLPQDYVEPVNDSLIAVIYFPINSKVISDSIRAKIQQAMTPWLDQKSIVVFINGYTDNSGNPMLNEELSYLRANLVSSEVSSMGIDIGNIQAKGWGEANPLAPNDNPDNMNLNRRVEIIIRR
jgi:outer membrane protein OmpA-like peptidoglycan-associated protein